MTKQELIRQNNEDWEAILSMTTDAHYDAGLGVWVVDGEVFTADEDER